MHRADAKEEPMPIRTWNCAITLGLVLLLGAPLPARAIKVFGGGKVGFTTTEVSGTNEAGIESRNSGVGGVVFGWEVNRWFAAFFEPSFTLKGADLTGIPSVPPMSELRLKYFELPLLAKFKWTKGPESRMGPYAALGLVLSINTAADLRVLGQDESINQEVRGVDWGFSFGAGFDFDIGTGVTILDIRYVLGFQNIFKDDSTNEVRTEDLKNRALQVTVGWVLPLN
jgi:hypothetical protein